MPAQKSPPLLLLCAGHQAEGGGADPDGELEGGGVRRPEGNRAAGRWRSQDASYEDDSGGFGPGEMST